MMETWIPRELSHGFVAVEDYDALTAALTAHTGVACLGQTCCEQCRIDGTHDPTVDAFRFLFTGPPDETLVDAVLDAWPNQPA